MTDQAARPRKQEQEPADDTIEEVGPGVLRTQLPINMPGLGHVNCYLLEDERGVAVVDPGLPGRDSHVALEARLKSAGFPLHAVHTVIVTHSHPDHFGGAGWLRTQTGAEVVTHRSFRMMWDPAEPPDLDPESAAVATQPAGDDEHGHDGEPDPMAPPDDPLPHVRRFPWETTPWGGPGHQMPWRRKMFFRAARRFPHMRRMPTPSVRLDEADTIRLAGRDWVAVHTPGHTDDHLCLFDPTEGCMLCGDHVLPTITPHIGGFGTARDPLGAFFHSLDKVVDLGSQVKIALPAHGKPFADLAGRAQEIRHHHEGRLEKLRATSADLGRPASVMEMSTHLFSPRAQGSMADSETFAHLEHLRLAGEMVRRDADGVLEYVLTD
jgi:glyoxylase-like metal-dependent hydrolase (beta-lactamase superfamily II)